MNGKVQINSLQILIPFEKEIPFLVLRNHSFIYIIVFKPVNWLHPYLQILVRDNEYTDNNGYTHDSCMKQKI